MLALQETMQSILNQFFVTVDEDDEIVSASLSCYLPVVPYSDVFKKMKDSSSSYMVTFYKRLAKAVDNLTNAVNLESAHDAGEYVRKVLGDEFEVPEKEAVVTAAQNRREHSFGE